MNSHVIPELTNAIQNFVRHRTRPGEGTLIEARQLAKRWKFLDRPLFDSSTHDLTLLLAGLVVGYRGNHELLELIRRHAPEQLDKLIRESFDAEAQTPSSERSDTQSILTPKQRHEQKRRKWNRVFARSIEFQFGASLADLLDWRIYAFPLLGPDSRDDLVRQSQTCLDDIFAREKVNTQRLEELFWMDRRRFAKVLRSFHTRRLNYLAVTKVMDFLLKERSRVTRKKSKRGRSPRQPWLCQDALRMRVLRGIESRISSLSIASDVATAFLTVIRAHLPRSGEK